MQAPAFTLRMLGGLVLQTADGPVGGRVAQRRRLALLALVATAPGRVLSRDKLLGLLWPEASEEQARHRLSSALYDLRQLVGDGLLTRGADLWLDPALIASDVEQFEAALATNDRERAAQLYAGPFLDGVHLSGTPEFDYWREEVRGRLARAYTSALERWATQLIHTGDTTAALDTWYALTALEPHNGRVTLELMRILNDVGESSAALARAAEHTARLLEVGAEPSPEVLAFADQLRATSAVRSPLVEPSSSGEPRSGNRGSQFQTTVQSPAVAPVRSPALWFRRPAQRLFVVCAVAASGIVGGAALVRRSAAGSDTSVIRVAVLPFAVRGNSEQQYLAEGIVDLLSTSLDGAGRIRTVDPHVVLGRSRAAGEEGSGAEGRLAHGLGAESYVRGSIVAVGGALRIRATWYSAGSENRPAVAQAVVEGRTTDVLELVDALAAQLIAAAANVPAERITRVAARTTHSLPALKAYLAGEAAFRVGRFLEAIEAFDRAVTEDSTFALAHYRRSLATLWANRDSASTDASDASALRHMGRLSVHDRSLVQGYLAWRNGAAGTAERHYREIVGAYPNDVEAWFQLGETLFHYNPLRGRPVEEARAAFEQVVALDSTNWGAPWHLALLAAQQRRWSEVNQWLGKLRGLDADGERLLEARVLGALAARDPVAFDRVLPELGGTNATRLIELTWRAAVAFQDFDAATKIARFRLAGGSRYERMTAHVDLAYLEAARGRRQAARNWLDKIAAVTQHLPQVLAARVLPEVVPSFESTRAVLHEVEEKHLRRPGRSDELEALRVYLNALLRLAAGDTATARITATHLQHDISDSINTARGRYASTLTANRSFKVDNPRITLDELEKPTSLGWYGFNVSDPILGMAHERFLRAEALYASARYDEAARWYATFGEHALCDLIYLAPAQLRLGDLAERLGRRADAAVHYARFVELWRDADPELQPLVQRARQRLERLSN